MTYAPTIGLEIHAELNTATKMFCCSKNDPLENRPNVNICPVCLAHPGTLPVINREAVAHVLRVGVALGGTLADYTEFDRKNYFYPDLPKGYQISQYEYPLVSGGTLADVALTRIHLEEDTASSIHDEKTGATMVDYNRSGLPLMELVTEPVIHTAEHAGKFAKELQQLLRYLGASEANMEEGQMRVEANISVGKDGVLGTKVEVKNLNSFRAMERAVAYEIKRQTELIEKGGNVMQETRGWDEGRQETFSQRAKEVAADYRYFPDPDLPSLKLSEIPDLSPERLQATMPELPAMRLSRYLALGIKEEDARQYVANKELGDFFDKVAAIINSQAPKLVITISNYIANDLASLLRDIDRRDTGKQSEIRIAPSNFAKLIMMFDENKISSRGAKDILAEMVENDRDPETVAGEKGLFQKSSKDDLLPIVRKVLESNLAILADYKAGKDAALKALIGHSMKATKGSGNPEMIRELLVEMIAKL